jgi:hypothetical protein
MTTLACIDPTYQTKKVLALSMGSWGAVAESHLQYDPGSFWNTWLITRFFDGLSLRLAHGIPNIEEGRSAVVEAARHALALSVPSEHGVPYLMFSVLIESRSEWWVYNVGPNLIFHLGKGRTRIVIPPHSALERLKDEGRIVEEWRELGTAHLATLVAAQTSGWETDVRFARITPQAGDWLLVAAHSVAGHGVLKLDSPPTSRTDLEGIVEMLAKPYANYPRTWVAANA